ncbi:prepilin-type N-terminal cleavage/methylation domain-containing protein [Candidatus Saccharibacteria bacterium]|nr:prepilin-type N-terminal cleavage/methylation domain-containing protein [Candidatus Saccharibacteria bacterium]
MFKKLHKDNRGFTIIEVLIVLAIAGLIMLIVFLAVPALQRNQRNNARTGDAARIAAAVSECLANRNGRTDSCNELVLDANFVSTTASELQVGTMNQLTGGLTGGSTITSGILAFGTICDPTTTNSTTLGATARSFTLVFKLEPDISRCITS